MKKSTLFLFFYLTAVFGELRCFRAFFKIFEAVTLHVACLLCGKTSVVEIYSADWSGSWPLFCSKIGGNNGFSCV